MSYKSKKKKIHNPELQVLWLEGDKKIASMTVSSHIISVVLFECSDRKLYAKNA